jgi:parallel beta-helix repeat protein
VLLGACLLLASVLAAQPLRALSSVTVPASIDASGGDDVTAQLNSFLATLPKGVTVDFPNDARYRVEGVLRLTNVHDVTIVGHGARLVAKTDGSNAALPDARRYRPHWPRLREHLSITDSQGVTIKDLSIEGPNDDGKYQAKLEGQAGIAVYGSTNIEIDDNTISKTFGDGVYVAGASSDVRVRNNTFSNIGRQGVAVVNATKATIEGNHFDKIARSVVDLEPAVPKWNVADVHVRDNEVGDFGNYLLAAGGAGTGVNDVWLEHNHVTGGNGLAVYAGMERWLRHGLHVVGNTSDAEGRRVSGSTRGGVMQIAGIDGVEITGNQQRVAGIVAITLTRVCNAEIKDNRFPGASEVQRSTGSCSDVPVADSSKPARRGTTPTTRERVKSDPAKQAQAAPAKTSHDDSTDSGWLIAGALTGVVVLVVLGALAWRRSRRLRT